jgi:cation:H+ antiporter
VAFDALPLGTNALLFALAAAAVWAAGLRLSTQALVLAARFGIGRVFVGALLLGGVTSLPEVAATGSASALGNAPLAVNNLFGGIALQVAILALADLVVRGRALSSRIDDDTVLLQAALLVLVLVIAVSAVVLDDVPVLGVGVGSLAVFGTCVGAMWLVHRHESARQGGWVPTARRGDTPQDAREVDAVPEAVLRLGTGALLVRIAVAAAVILVAGYVLAETADVLGRRTGLGAGFMGAAFLALATSLPEVSTTLGAVRHGAYAMAYGNIFGSNILDAAIILLADGLYPGPPVLNEVGAFSAVAGLLGIALTTVWLAGLVRRRARVVAGLGYDSAAVLLLYAGGLAVLFVLR